MARRRGGGGGGTFGVDMREVGLVDDVREVLVHLCAAAPRDNTTLWVSSADAKECVLQYCTTTAARHTTLRSALVCRGKARVRGVYVDTPTVFKIYLTFWSSRWTV